jgi:hypothetical protein
MVTRRMCDAIIQLGDDLAACLGRCQRLDLGNPEQLRPAYAEFYRLLIPKYRRRAKHLEGTAGLDWLAMRLRQYRDDGDLWGLYRDLNRHFKALIGPPPERPPRPREFWVRRLPAPSSEGD